MAQIIICGGGSGGHVLPAVALADELDKRKIPNILVTDKRGSRFLPKERQQKTPTLEGGDYRPEFRARLTLARHWLKMTRILLREFKRLRLRTMVAFGGYFVPPLAVAAKLSGARLIIHEQNAVAGAANRLLARLADVKAVAIANTLTDAVTVGIPMSGASQAESAAQAPPRAKPFVLSVLGGSQGSIPLMETVLNALNKLPPRMRKTLVLNLQCREQELARARRQCKKMEIKATLKPFFAKPMRILSQSHLLVTRAGAGALNAALIAGRAAIVLPYPHAANRHQHANASHFVRLGAGWMLEDNEVDKLADLLLKLLGDRKQLLAKARNAAAAAIPDAAEKLADLALALDMDSKNTRIRS